MLTNKWGKLWALVMAFAVPISLMSAETSGAVIYATNTARLNGTQVTKTAAIFPGDKLVVPDNSSVTISLKGTSILVPKNSNVSFAENAVELGAQTAVAVNTTSGMAAEIQDVKISPANDGTAEYQVARYNGQVFVSAKEGTVLLASAAGTREIPAGTSAHVPDPAPQTQTPTATSGLSGIPTWVAEVIGLAAVGAAAAIGIAATNKSASPSVP